MQMGLGGRRQNPFRSVLNEDAGDVVGRRRAFPLSSRLVASDTAAAADAG